MTAKDKKIIEDSEARGIPIFVLTAKDGLSVPAILEYLKECILADCNKQHTDGICARITQFMDWQANNPTKTKLPD